MSGRRSGRAAVAACLLLAAACTPDPPPPGPTSAAATPTGEAETDSIVIGVDTVGGGYNPHAVADSTTTTRALAQMMLPSVFRTATDGTPELDETLMRSARVTSDDPFTVTYTIRPDASWSDGAPIAAEDFNYLADAMRSQPGTIGSAGYRLIDDVSSRQGGKVVEVTFEEQYDDWQSLFTHLLPSHLLKDAPGGWQEAMGSGYPAYGGPFSIKSADTARGEILLERNERYWEKPAAVDQLVLRRSDSDGIATALRNGDTQFALTRADHAGVAALDTLGEHVEQTTVPRPEIAQVVLRPQSPTLSDDDVRGAVAASVDRSALIEAGTGGDPARERAAASQVYAPSQSGYEPAIPDAAKQPDPQRAQQLMTDAGYHRSAGRWRSAGRQAVSVTVASPAQQQPYTGIAEELVDQLTDAGFDVDHTEPEPRELFGTAPETEGGDDADDEADTDAEESPATADIVVGPRPVTAEPGAGLVSRLSCRDDDSNDDDSDGPEPASGNVAGYCDEDLQPTLDSLLTGQRQVAAAAPHIEQRLWDDAVTVPLFQLADVLAVTEDVAGVTEGPPLTGPFHRAVDWIRTDG